MSGYEHKPPANLPELQVQWANEARKLQEAIETSHRRAEKLANAALSDRSLSSQTTTAALAELKAAQAYNAFLDKDREYTREGDAEERILNTRNNLSPLERHQIETTRDQKWATSGEFQHWKTAQGLNPASVAAINTDTDTHFPDGHTERRGTPQGMAANAWDNTKRAAGAFVDAVKQGPSNGFNQPLCEGLIGLGLRRLAPRLPSGTNHTVGNHAWGRAQSEAKGATDPAGDTCRLIYPSSRSLKDLEKYGAVNTIQDPEMGLLHVVDVDRKLLDGLLPGGLGAFEEPLDPERSTTPSSAEQASNTAAATATVTAIEANATQQAQIDRFKTTMDAKLTEHGMSPAQIDTLAAATVAHHAQTLGDKTGPDWYALKTDGSTIGMRYPPGVFTEMNVADALAKSPSEHIAQANQNDDAKSPKATEAQVMAMNDAPSFGGRSAQR